MKSYETELVPIPAKTKWLYICLSTIGAAFGFGIFVNSVGTDSTDKAPGVIWGLIIAALGVFFLVQSIRKTHERVITEAGKAAIAVKAKADARARAENNAALMVFLFWVAVIAVGIYCIEPVMDMFGSRISAYPVICSTQVPGTDKCAANAERAGNAIKYIVHVDQQLVVGLAENAAAPMKLYNCVVADVKNWSCAISAEKDATRIAMRDGDFTYDPTAMYVPGLRFVSRHEYLITKYMPNGK